MKHLYPLFSRLSWLALVIGLSLTGVATWQVKQASDSSAIKDFSFITEQITTTVEERLKAYALILRGAAGLFDASDEVTRQEWEHYVSNLQLEKAIPGISGVNFAIQVPSNELAAHTASIKAEGFAQYRIWPSHPRENYTALLFLSPFNARNQKALGYDMFADPVRRQAMIQARDTGMASLSAKVTLVIEDQDNPQAGVLMFVPVYRAGSRPQTLVERRAALIGWTLSGYRMDDLIQGMLGDWQERQAQAISLRVYDGAEDDLERLLYQSHPLISQVQSSRFAQQRIVQFNGRSWLLSFDYVPPQQAFYASTWGTLFTGLMLTGLLFLLIRTFSNTHIRARALAQQLTEKVHHSEQQLKMALQRLQTIASRVPGMVYEYRLYPDGSSCFPYASEGIEKVYGVSQQQLQEEPNVIFQLVYAEDLASTLSSIKESAAKLAPWRHEYRIHHPNGAVHWLYGDSQPHQEADGSISWYGLVTDITERKQAELALTAANHQTLLFRQALDHVPSCIFMKDNDLRYTYANRATLELLGCNEATLLGSSSELFFAAETAAQLRAADAYVLTGEAFQNEFSYTSPEGRTLCFLDVKAPIYDKDDTKSIVGMLGISTDITALKANEQKLEHQAHYDNLTKLPNRLMLADRLHQAMLQARRHQQSLAIVYLDLDGFKHINDNYGHEAGDQLLVTVATRMKAAIREGDTLARLGGDEFVAILLDIASLDDSIPLLNRLLQAAARPVPLGNHRLQVTASLGVTFYPQPEDLEPEQLIRQADQAMYQAKLAGKNRYCLFDTEQARDMREHHQSLEHIRAALLADEFVLYYQPKVNMRSGDIIGVEALIRWQHPVQGLLAPGYFLPFIEEHRLAVDLGGWVIDHALQQILSWQQAGVTLAVSVNIAARHLRQPDFCAQLATHLAKYPSVAPALLELEVLETSTLGDLAQISHTLEQCRRLGVGISLDDFGTGYSSLTYLKRLPANIIKVDQSFIRDILEDPEDLAILDGVLSLAKAFGRHVIAEGVETINHGDTLLRMGCELAQGYGIARPMPAEQVLAWVMSWQAPAHWSHIRPLNRDEFPLLYAGLEHKAWINEVIALLQHAHNNETWPVLDVTTSHLANWLNSQPKIAAARLARQQQLYQQTQQLVAELEQQYKAGHHPDLMEQLDTLCELRRQLLDELEACMKGAH